jgi:hypothetical protein
MVAGQPINTQAQTKEYDEGFDRTFGADRKARPGRTVYTSGGQPLPEPIQVGEEWTGAEKRALTPTEELTYGNLKATDGAPINTRKRHREYLKQNGLAMAHDYSPEYQQREASRVERQGDKERREMVERNAYKLFGG